MEESYLDRQLQDPEFRKIFEEEKDKMDAEDTVLDAVGQCDRAWQTAIAKAFGFDPGTLTPERAAVIIAERVQAKNRLDDKCSQMSVWLDHARVRADGLRAKSTELQKENRELKLKLEWGVEP